MVLGGPGHRAFIGDLNGESFTLMYCCGLLGYRLLGWPVPRCARTVCTPSTVDTKSTATLGTPPSRRAIILQHNWPPRRVSIMYTFPWHRELFDPASTRNPLFVHAESSGEQITQKVICSCLQSAFDAGVRCESECFLKLANRYAFGYRHPDTTAGDRDLESFLPLARHGPGALKNLFADAMLTLRRIARTLGRIRHLALRRRSAFQAEVLEVISVRTKLLLPFLSG